MRCCSIARQSLADRRERRSCQKTKNGLLVLDESTDACRCRQIQSGVSRLSRDSANSNRSPDKGDSRRRDSSCPLCMAETLLQLPNLACVEDTRKRRILAKTARFLSLGTQELANLFHRMMQELAPFRITTEQSRSVGIQAGPAGQILLGESKQIRLLAQSRGSAAAQLKTDFV